MPQTIIGALRVVLGLDGADFIQGATAVEARMRGMQAQMQRVGQRMQSVGRTMTLGMTLPLIGIGTAAIRAAAESEQASAAVQAALTSMGDGAGRSLSDLTDQATELSHNSLFQDDEILTKVTANMLTFGNVSGEVFDRAQQAALDLSARLGTDLQGSAIMVGKALNDPIQGISALTRVGVSFTDQQREQIRTMQQAGDIAGAQGVILEELTRQVGGQAAALAATDAGHMTQAWNQIGEALEAVGKVILPIIGDIAVKVRDAAIWFQDLSPATQEWIVIAAGIAAILGPVVIALGLFVAAIAPIAGLFAAISLPVAAVVIAIAALTYVVWQNWDAIQAWVVGAIQGAADAIAGIAQAFQDSVAYIAQKIEDIWTGITTTISGWVTGFYQLGVDMIMSLQAGIQSAVVGLFVDLDQIGQSVADSIGGSLGLSVDMSSVGADAANGLALGVDGQLPWLRDSGAAMGDALITGARDRLDIRSPSRVFEQIGRFVMEGMGLGIEGGTAGVRGQMQVVADQMTGATDDMAARMHDKFKSIGSWMVDLARGATTLRDTLANAVQGWGSKITSAGMAELDTGLTGLFGDAGGGLLSGIFGGLIGANAAGTDSWRGGLTRVNEMGGEIMNLPRGTQIIPHDVSMQMARDSAASQVSAAPVYNIDARGAQAGVADQIVAALRAYDAQMPDRVRGVIADPRAA